MMKRPGEWRKLLSFKLFRNQIILWFMAVIVLLLGVMAGFTIGVLRPSLYDTHVSNLQKDVELLSWELTNKRATLQSYSVNILADTTVQQFLHGTLEDTSDISNRLRLLMMRYTEYDNSIRNIYLVDGQGDLYGNNVTGSIRSFVEETLEEAYQSSGGALWTTRHQGGTVMMYRVIHDTQRDLNQKIGALYMVIDARSFTDVCRRFLGDGVEYRLEGAEGALVLGNSLPEDQEAERYFICQAERGAWRLSAWILRENVYAVANSVLNLVMASLAAVMLIGVAMTVFISGRLTKPLREIRHAMIRAGGGDLDANVSVHREDEIARLARTYNRMLIDTKEFIRQNEENQRRQRELELNTLQYQINPHFLYNTLDSIYMIARHDGSEHIAELVISLSKLFRLSLAHGREVVSLQHEIQYVTSYLEIQRIRFPDTFTWRIDVPDELLRCRVLKFLLQPLVENCLSHGLRNTPEGGEILLTARHDGVQLIIQVSDNGQGMTVAQLADLRWMIDQTDAQEIADPFAGGVGVRNVHQRLLLRYGRGLEIESEWDEGTTVTIHIPLQTTYGQEEPET